MTRLVFTFGTLYEDDIIHALLGSIPTNFYATLAGFAIHRGTFAELPKKIQDVFSAKGYTNDNFSYLFIKPAANANPIQGRAYSIDLGQELILDHWEWYPEWYRKQTVSVRSSDGSKHEAFVYTLDYQGENLDEFKRVVNDPQKVLEAAKATRAQVKTKIPEAFR